MASLDVLDYQLGLDAALEKEGLPANLRGQAVKEARRTIDALAFRFALMDERPLPEEHDYLRALQAVKPADRAAAVLAKRRPLYARVRRRRLVTSTTILVGFTVLLLGGYYLATSETADEVALVAHNVNTPSTFSDDRTFFVFEDVTRLHLDGTFLVNRNSPGLVEVRVIDPEGNTRLYEAYAAGGNIYLRENINDPQPGLWRILVDFLDAQGSVRVTVDAIRPAR